MLIVPGVSLLVCLNQYDLPGTSGSSAIQTTIASNFCSTRGTLPGRTSMSPRLTSISSSSVSVTDCGAKASSSSPSNVTIDFTRLVFREGRAMISSPLADDARGDRAAEAAEVEVRPIDELHGEAEVLEVAVGADVDVFQRCISVGPLYHGVFWLCVDDVVALEGRHRDEVHVGQVEPRGEALVVGADLLEDLLAEIDEVHLVDGHDDVLDAQQRDDEASAAWSAPARRGGRRSE